MSLSKLFLTKASDGSQVVVGPTAGDQIKIQVSGGTHYVLVTKGPNTVTYAAADFQSDPSTPQAYETTAKLTVRFEDFFHNVYTYVLQNDGDKVVWSTITGATWITVWQGGTSHAFPAGFLKPDASSPCGAA